MHANGLKKEQDAEVRTGNFSKGNAQDSSKRIGITLIIAGLIPCLGGIWLLTQGHSPLVLAMGIIFVISGALLASRSRSGPHVRRSTGDRGEAVNFLRTNSTKPAKTIGIVLIFLGLVPCIGGIWLLTRGDSPYFLIIGAGVIISGILLSAGKRLGLIAYGITLGIIIVWSAIEAGGDPGTLTPRISVPIIIAVYIYQKKIRDSLR